MSIGLCLTSKDTSGIPMLIFDVSKHETILTLVGKYKGESIQIDFDPLTVDETKDLIALLQKRLEIS